MKNYSKLKWFLFIPWIGIGVIFFSILSECRFRPNKLFVGYLIVVFISALIGGIVGELTLFLIAKEIVLEKLLRIVIILFFMHIASFIWCLIISRKRKKNEQEEVRRETRKMKNYSKIRWLLLIPILGVVIVVFSVCSKDQYQPVKHYIKMFLWLGISGVIGVILFVIFYTVIKSVNGSISTVLTMILVCIIFLSMHIGMFIWCSIVARKRKTEEQNV